MIEDTTCACAVTRMRSSAAGGPTCHILTIDLSSTMAGFRVQAPLREQALQWAHAGSPLLEAALTTGSPAFRSTMVRECSIAQTKALRKE